jgi:hypothetical protein
MSQKNLWGQLPTPEEIRPPTQILKEQGALLSETTKGVLRGEVSVSQAYGRFQLELEIVAPALDNYRYSVLEATHELEMYPVTVKPGWDKSQQQVDCTNEAEFESALADILSSDQIRRVVTALLAQSRAM